MVNYLFVKIINFTKNTQTFIISLCKKNVFCLSSPKSQASQHLKNQCYVTRLPEARRVYMFCGQKVTRAPCSSYYYILLILDVVCDAILLLLLLITYAAIYHYYLNYLNCLVSLFLCSRLVLILIIIIWVVEIHCIVSN